MSTFAERILGGACGTVVTVEPDIIVVNDGVSHGAIKDVQHVAYPDRVYVIYDHDVPTGRPEAAAILKENLTFARTYGCRYIQAQGTGYQYLCNEVVGSGQIIAGGGSHGAIYGAREALGIDVSLPELARIIETGRYSTVVPETVYLNLTGALPEGVTALDAGLAFLELGKELKKKALEVYAPSFSQHEKEVFLSTAALSGIAAASFCEEKPAEALTLDLSKIFPMAMGPCQKRPDQGKAPRMPLSDLSGMELQAGQIGGYTGGTIEDLRAVAQELEGKKLKLGYRLSICPCTSRDYLLACQEGLIEKFIDYGAQIHAAGDRSVVIQGAGAMGPGEKLLTTGLYTFAGAMGVESAEIYTASPLSVARSSYTGCICPGQES